MELTSADRLIWGVWSFIALIAYLRWCGTREDEKKARPPELAKRREHKTERLSSIQSLRLMSRSSPWAIPHI